MRIPCQRCAPCDDRRKDLLLERSVRDIVAVQALNGDRRQADADLRSYQTERCLKLSHLVYRGRLQITLAEQ